MVLQEQLEKDQNKAARFVTSNYYFGTGSFTGILEKIRWETCIGKGKMGRKKKDSRVILLYKGLKRDLIPTN